jgi:hypothetical protein
MHVENQERESKANKKLLEAHRWKIGEIKEGMKEFGGNLRD